jgi:hypothetical protein
MTMLSELALYHYYKLSAAARLCFYEETGSKSDLAASIKMMEKAREKWLSFAKLGEKYHSRLTFFLGENGKYRDGNWKDFIPELDADLEKLRSLAEGEAAAPPEVIVPMADVASPGWFDDAPDSCKAGEALAITLETGPVDCFRGAVNLRYRHTNQMEGKFISAPMRCENGLWRAEIPAEYIVPEWDLLVYFQATAQNGDGLVFPGIWNSEFALPYHIIEVE